MSSEGGGSGSNNPGGTRPVFPTRARQRVQAPDPGPALPRAAAFQPKVVRQLEPTIPEPAPARAAPPPAQAPAPAPRQFPNVGRDAPLAPPPTPGSASKSYTTGPNVLQATNITSTQPRNAYGVTPPPTAVPTYYDQPPQSLGGESWTSADESQRSTPQRLPNQSELQKYSAYQHNHVGPKRPHHEEVHIENEPESPGGSKWKHSWSILAANRLSQSGKFTNNPKRLPSQTDDDELAAIGRASQQRTRSVVMYGCVGLFVIILIILLAVSNAENANCPEDDCISLSEWTMPPFPPFPPFPAYPSPPPSPPAPPPPPSPPSPPPTPSPPPSPPPGPSPPPPSPPPPSPPPPPVPPSPPPSPPPPVCTAAGACYMNADGGQVCQFKETGSTAFVACFDVDGSQLVGENGSCGGLTCFFSNPARVDSQCTC